MNATKVFNMIRALNKPYPGAFSFRGKDKVKIYSASIPDLSVKGVPGRVCYIQGTGPYVMCSDRGLLVHNYIIENEFRNNADEPRLRRGDQLNSH